MNRADMITVPNVPRVTKARLDAEGTAQPLTRLVHHPKAGDATGPGIPPVNPQYENEDGDRIALIPSTAADYSRILQDNGDRIAGDDRPTLIPSGNEEIKDSRDWKDDHYRKMCDYGYEYDRLFAMIVKLNPGAVSQTRAGTFSSPEEFAANCIHSCIRTIMYSDSAFASTGGCLAYLHNTRNGRKVGLAYNGPFRSQG